MSLSRQEKYTPPEKDEVYDLLSNHRRRYVIHYCKQQDGPVSLSELAEQIAAWEHEKEISEITSAERKRVYTSLQQTHLQRLEEAGMITFENHSIELTEGADKLDVYLDIVPEGSIPWGVYYLGLSLLSVVVLIGLWVEFVPTEPIPVVGWAMLIIFVFLASSAYQVWQDRLYRLDRIDRPP